MKLHIYPTREVSTVRQFYTSFHSIQCNIQVIEEVGLNKISTTMHNRKTVTVVLREDLIVLSYGCLTFLYRIIYSLPFVIFWRELSNSMPRYDVYDRFISSLRKVRKQALFILSWLCTLSFFFYRMCSLAGPIFPITKWEIVVRTIYHNWY